MTTRAAVGPGRPPILGFLALLAVAMVPLALAEPLPMVDLPNHLARAYVIANINTSEVFPQFFAVDWQFLPNLGVDLILPPLLKVLPHHAVTVGLAALILALTAGGAVAVHHALWQRWSAFPLLVFIFLYSYSFLWGFLNFVLSIALALWVFFAWLKLRHLSAAVRLPLFAVLAGGLAIIHLYGFAIYAVLVGTYELSRLALSPVREWVRGLPTLLLNAVPFVPAIAFVLMSRTAEHEAVVWGTVRGKLGGLIQMFETYNLPLDLAAMAVFGLVFAFALVTGRVVVHRTMILAVAVLVVLYFALPLNALGSGYVDLGILPVIAIVALAVSDWRVGSAPARRWIIGGFVGLFLVRISVVALAWAEAGSYFSDVRSAFSVLRPGDRLAAAVVFKEGDYPTFPPTQHLAAMAIVEQDAYANVLFHFDAAQPLDIIYGTDPDYRGCCAHEMQIDHGGPIPNPFERIPLQDFDYLVVFGSDLLTAEPPADLSVVRNGPNYVLYRLPATATDAPPQ